jgi:hypothetical protein
MSLKNTLAELVDQADEHAPRPVRSGQLAGGLNINVRRAESHYVLILWRFEVHPSPTEWKVILRNWPYFVQDTTPTKGAHEGHYFLRGILPMDRTPVQKS